MIGANLPTIDGDNPKDWNEPASAARPPAPPEAIDPAEPMADEAPWAAPPSAPVAPCTALAPCGAVGCAPCAACVPSPSEPCAGAAFSKPSIPGTTEEILLNCSGLILV